MNPDDPEDDAERAWKEARRLASVGDFEGALAKHVWFHNNALSIRPSYYGVRLSYAMSAWIELGQKYPEALQKLKNIRDDATSQLVAAKPDRGLFHDVARINEHLAESERTVLLFKRIAATYPEAASEIYELADKSLVQAHEYAIAREFMGDPDIRFARRKYLFDEGMKYAMTSKRPVDSVLAHESIFAEEVILLITILTETGDEVGARRIQLEALKMLDTPEFRNAIKHLKPAG